MALVERLLAFPRIRIMHSLGDTKATTKTTIEAFTAVVLNVFSEFACLYFRCQPYEAIDNRCFKGAPNLP